MYAKVTAHLYKEDEGSQTELNARQNNPAADDESSTTIYVIKFAKEVTNREKGSTL